MFPHDFLASQLPWTGATIRDILSRLQLPRMPEILRDNY